ncbi:hypothetical protein H5410_000719 [Solanum commersonii]|uniref:Uncharacterized protein n=1 Tax=Solanum commersonii TaxID=4109 RepID=A0A9J6AXK0_SOLCO|nr:hypothetical protein H5410_000719 [Solanum commersonii]
MSIILIGVGDGGGGEFTPKVDRCIDGVDLKEEEILVILVKAIVTMKSKRGIRPSSKISHPYTPDYVKRTKRQI